MIRRRLSVGQYMQDVSSMMRFGVKPIIFLINNKVPLRTSSYFAEWS